MPPRRSQENLQTAETLYTYPTPGGLEMVKEGRFREDLLARIHLWTFSLPGLADRREDIAPNVDYELGRFSDAESRMVAFNKGAPEKFLRFARAADTPWSGNFRDLNSAITRMATLAPRGRIRVEEVEEEMERLRVSWEKPGSGGAGGLDLRDYLGAEEIAEIDLFDQRQLAFVIGVCRESRSLSEAGRTLFDASRKKRAVTNDADRVKKYLKRFGLSFEGVTGGF